MGDGATETPYKQNQKMLSKDFKTITLRDLDQKSQVTDIMNQVMQKHGIKTGQAVIEFIIADYDKKAKELEKWKEKYENFYHNHYKIVDKQDNEIKDLKTKLKTIKNAFEIINKIED